ncbi:MAG: Na+/H+ antiporter NhaA [Solirubrobacterales bacterium]
MPPLRDEDPDVRSPRRFRRPWLRSERPVPRAVVQPLERFLREEAGSGSLLLAAAVAALVWANFATDAYGDFWTTRISVELGSLSFDEDLRHLVNDLLMALFFFVVALEVKREMLHGSLADRATASVPVAAALGTMVGAAFVYLAINLGGGEPRGWAIPIATDIAFALAVLGVAGRRVPSEARAFLLTLAVVDDVGTIVVIALFFSGGIEVAWLGGAAVVAVAIVVLQRLHVRHLSAYVLLAALLWIAVFESGIHATIAGVLLGFMTPGTPFHPRQDAAREIGSQLKEISDDPASEVSAAAMWETSRLARESVSPLARLEEQLHPWSAYLVLPLFALANAGVEVSASEFGDALTGQVGLGIVLGLVIGAPLGGILLSRALVRLTPTRLPDGLDWSAIAAIAPLKGIGFTVAIFLAVLAFDDDPALRDEAKLAILAASAVAALLGLAAIWARHRGDRSPPSGGRPSGSRR